MTSLRDFCPSPSSLTSRERCIFIAFNRKFYRKLRYVKLYISLEIYPRALDEYVISYARCLNIDRVSCDIDSQTSSPMNIPIWRCTRQITRVCLARCSRKLRISAIFKGNTRLANIPIIAEQRMRILNHGVISRTYVSLNSCRLLFTRAVYAQATRRCVDATHRFDSVTRCTF